MRKNAAIILAAFYLLLTTGLYVCFLSCGTKHLLHYVASWDGGPKEQKKHCHQSEKNCKGDKDCSCCKKHGQYSVKENEKAAPDFEFLKLPAFTFTLAAHNDFFYIRQSTEITHLPRIKAPPLPGMSPPLFIKNLTLLI